jgi:L-fuconolactonase
VPRKIDAHCHVWPATSDRWPTLQGIDAADRVPAQYPVETHLSALEELGVEAAVIVPHIGYYGRDLGYALDCAARYPGRIAVMGAITGVEVANPELLRGDLDLGVRAFRLRAIDLVRGADGLCGWMADEDAVLCPLITAAQPEALVEIDRLAAAHETLTIVIDHFGGAPGSKALRDLARHPNVFVKISGFNTWDAPPYLRSHAALLELLPAFGAERLMWGSDMPVFAIDPNQSLTAAFEVIDKSDSLSRAQRAALMGETADRLFFDRET